MVILAPMAGITDLAFRLVVKSYGCDFVVSEMISAQGVIYNNRNTKQLLKSDPKERPLAVQLFGHDPQILAEAAGLIEQEYQPDIIDLNMGCPTPKIVKNGDGAALLKQPKLIEQIVAAVVEKVNIPVTAKIRLGWDQNSINCLEVARRVEDAGGYWITVHARTREQFYRGSAQWDYITKIKEHVNIPVVANGDIIDELSAEKIQQTGCDHIMIGRGVLGRPWVPNHIKTYLETGRVLPEPSIAERFAAALKHLKLKMDLIGEESAVREMRTHLAWYLKGLPDSRNIKCRIKQVSLYDEVKLLLEEFEKTLALKQLF